MASSTEWFGVRITLGCTHMDLADDRGDVRIGGLRVCIICPTRFVPGSGDLWPIRQVVNVEDVKADRPPDQLPDPWPEV